MSSSPPTTTTTNNPNSFKKKKSNHENKTQQENTDRQVPRTPRQSCKRRGCFSLCSARWNPSKLSRHDPSPAPPPTSSRSLSVSSPISPELGMPWLPSMSPSQQRQVKHPGSTSPTQEILYLITKSCSVPEANAAKLVRFLGSSLSSCIYVPLDLWSCGTWVWSYEQEVLIMVWRE